MRPRRSPFCPSRILRSRKDAEQIPDQEKSAKRDSCVSADICGRWRPGRNLDGQTPNGRCRILSLWDIVQNSIGTTRKPRGRSHSKKCSHHSWRLPSRLAVPVFSSFSTLIVCFFAVSSHHWITDQFSSAAAAEGCCCSEREESSLDLRRRLGACHAR
jgi:hypothetical protein